MAKKLYPDAFIQAQATEKTIVATAEQRMLLAYVCGGFEWSGLPDGLTSQQLEYFVTHWTLAAGYEDSVGGAMILPATWGADLNSYYLPKHYLVSGFGISKQVEAKKAVAFYDNSARFSMRTMIETTAEELHELRMVKRQNARFQKNPRVFAGDADSIQTLKAAYAKVEEFKDALFVTNETKDALKGGIEMFDGSTPFLGAELGDEYMQTLNRFLTCLGFDNIPIQKKERLITDEAHGNDELVAFNRMDRLKMREQAAQEFNEKFGTNLSVRWVGSPAEKVKPDDEEEGEEE